MKSQNSLSVKKLTSNELQARERGLCYNDDKIYHPEISARANSFCEYIKMMKMMI